MSSPRIAIVIYSMYGHIAKMAEAVKGGVESAGGKATIYQVAETLPKEVLTKMGAPPKPSYAVMDAANLPDFDGVIFGIPTRFGSMPAQMKALFDATAAHWSSGALYGKYAGIFTATATLGGGQETTILQTISCLTHQGMIYVPLGYKHTFGPLANLTEVHGGSPWGAGTLAAPDGSRSPSELEIGLATTQGKVFYETLARVKF